MTRTEHTPPAVRDHHLAASRQLLADLTALDCADVPAAYALLGRSEIVIAALLRMLDGE